jgi:hypothetical protein
MLERRNSAWETQKSALGARLDVLMMIQETMARMAMTAEQMRTMSDALGRLFVPGRQLEAMLELMEIFSPPATQIEAMSEQIEGEINQLKSMENELQRVRTTLDRFGSGAELLASFQEPMARLASAFLRPSVVREVTAPVAGAPPD